ncbi:hypothetical protein M9979_05010 [Sphingomonas sp. RP10(2022)]|uniref:DUF4398 domain-containing protein n=1 Tax=Sphingomonas liriopis TaxID=2949094 RepID=A0A9X2HY82_9SPHN|nr:hypothetical protein [Sphingomonas liriopis]MCP3734235.1 hypothetical protein [Sphingomonas liriopis]
MLRRLLLLCACTYLTGCAAVSGFPSPVFSAREEEAELQLYLRSASVEHYEQCADKFVCRNAIVDARLRAIDIAFYRFQRRLYRQESGASMGANMLSMAMDSIATVTATRGFAAGAGLLTGGRDAYSRQAMSVSMPLLLQEMAANRRELLVRIRIGMAMPVSAYSLIDALGDLSEYELAGSIPAAAAQLAANAGSQTRIADEKLAALRSDALARAQLQSAPLPIAPVMAPASPALVPVAPTAPARAIASAPATPMPTPSPSSTPTVQLATTGPSTNPSRPPSAPSAPSAPAASQPPLY